MANELASRWPPREGLPLFLLWMAGILVQRLVLTAFTAPPPVGSSGGPDLTWLTSLATLVCIVAVGTGAWQSWLIFRGGLRRVAWALVPLIPIFPLFRMQSLPWSQRVALLLAVTIL